MCSICGYPDNSLACIYVDLVRRGNNSLCLYYNATSYFVWCDRLVETKGCTSSCIRPLVIFISLYAGTKDSSIYMYINTYVCTYVRMYVCMYIFSLSPVRTFQIMCTWRMFLLIITFAYSGELGSWTVCSTAYSTVYYL